MVQGPGGYLGRTVITDDNDAIAAFLEDVSVPALMMSVVHMTGDPSILRRSCRPTGIYLNEVQGFMSPEDQAEVRAEALRSIIAYRDSGCVLPPLPDPPLVHEMMNVLVAEEVSEEYVPMLLDELELDGTDPRDLHWTDSLAPQDREGFHVLVIGAGMSGLLAGIRLSGAGIPFTVVEKNPGPGGTWWENRYPGCRVDVGNHFYCYSFAPNSQWSEFFARQPELQAYFERCMHDSGISDHVRFDTEVVGARWYDETATWSVDVRGADGSVEEVRANALISAVGQLNRPKIPDFHGRETFAGPAMHSAEWIDGTPLAGRRVAVIGTGASAFQIVPSIADQAARVTVFQRTAPWMFPNPHYHDRVGAGSQWAFEHLPYYGRWYRFLLFWPACDGGLPAMRVDPDWPDQHRSVSAVNDAARQVFTQWMADQIGNEPELLDKVVPDYVCLGKRTLQDNGSWLSALVKDNVELVTDPIAEITPEGVVGEDGTEYPVDILVYATGFHANRYLWPMEIVGRGGVTLAEQWGDRPTAYLGITVPNFPNLFCLYGPGTNLAHGGSLVFHSECQIRYIMGCISAIVGGPASIECRQDVHDAYNRRLQAELDTMVWSHPSIRHSWYRNAEGRIYILSPWRLVDYWRWTRAPELADFVLQPVGAGRTSRAAPA
ncbi:MAG: flavin-containing monooxygenase [Acidimicrobiales bacterium]